jgi:hypothetical protein
LGRGSAFDHVDPDVVVDEADVSADRERLREQTL